MSDLLAGIDIGGTKCAVCLGESEGAGVTLLEKRRFSTPPTPTATLCALGGALEELLAGRRLTATGISCGGPLDSAQGLILSPPNLPGWDHTNVVTPFRERFNAPAMLQNDANACALAEWQWGAGRGCHNMIFLTFGTGMGAGLIIDGRLYIGASDMAGEVGHVRLAETGPLGYGKRGSFEGFCSGGGIARWAQQRALAALQEGQPPAFCPTLETLPAITAESVGIAARAGDTLAQEIFAAVAQRLGQGLALLVDILNPERIVIGSIYGHQRELLETTVLQVLQAEAHPHALAVCDIVPAGLGEQVGDYAGLAVAALASKSAVPEKRQMTR
ncbi:MAG: ROK family protein [Anaerolineae bacterium]|nr:ROK family protein [Anaerolineae bacterium]